MNCLNLKIKTQRTDQNVYNLPNESNIRSQNVFKNNLYQIYYASGMSRSEKRPPLKDERNVSHGQET